METIEKQREIIHKATSGAAPSLENALCRYRALLDWAARARGILAESFGEKCPDFERGCIQCQAHELLEELPE